MAVKSSSHAAIVGPQAYIYIYTLAQPKVSIRCGQQFWSRLMSCGFVTWHQYASTQQLYTFLRATEWHKPGCKLMVAVKECCMQVVSQSMSHISTPLPRFVSFTMRGH
ncbi:TPA: hypothetical protein ACH3X3_013960 [Trebouxia sp. C0006]